MNFAQRATTAFNKFILQALHMVIESLLKFFFPTSDGNISCTLTKQAQAAILYNMTNRGTQPNFGSMVAGLVPDPRLLPAVDSTDGPNNVQRANSIDEQQDEVGAQLFGGQRWFSQNDITASPVKDTRNRPAMTHANSVSADNRHCPSPIEDELMIVETSSSVPDLPSLDDEIKRPKATAKPRGRKPRDKSKSKETNGTENGTAEPEQQPARKRLVRGAAKKAQKKISSWRNGDTSDSEMNWIEFLNSLYLYMMRSLSIFKSGRISFRDMSYFNGKGYFWHCRWIYCKWNSGIILKILVSVILDPSIE